MYVAGKWTLGLQFIRDASLCGVWISGRDTFRTLVHHQLLKFSYCYFGHSASNGTCAFLDSLLQSIDHFVCPVAKSAWWIITPRGRKIQISSSKSSWLLLDINFSVRILNCFLHLWPSLGKNSGFWLRLLWSY